MHSPENTKTTEAAPAKRHLSKSAVAKRYSRSTKSIERYAFDPAYAHLGFPKPVMRLGRFHLWDESHFDAFDATRG